MGSTCPGCCLPLTVLAVPASVLTVGKRSNQNPMDIQAKETIYLLKARVKVTVDGHGDDDGSFEIGGGDLVVFSKGMNITWEVIEAVKKHYHL